MGNNTKNQQKKMNPAQTNTPAGKGKAPAPAKTTTTASPAVFYVTQKVYVKGIKGYSAGTTCYAEVATYPKPTDKEVEVSIAGVKHMVPRENITAIPSRSPQRYSGYQRQSYGYTPTPRKKFSLTTKPTEDEAYMAELFCAKTHTEVVNLGIEGMSAEKYNVIVNKEWCALIPKGLKDTDKIPCLIAHTDLHPNLTHPTLENLEYEDGKFSSPTGLGADDRAGVFAINKMLRKHPGKFMVLFPDKEEVGLVGSKAFASSVHFDKFDKHASMFISIDRRREYNGDKTLATYGFNNADLNTWVSKLTDRKVVSGSSTDCRALSSASSRDVACFNFSCGYTSEHTRNETLYFSELLETVADLDKMLSEKDAFKAYTVPVKKTTNNYYYGDDEDIYEYMYGYGKPSTNNNKDTAKTTAKTEDADDTDNILGDLDDSDIEVLKDIYAFYTGSEYDSASPYIVPKLLDSDYVRVRPDMVVGQMYGGVRYTQDLKNVLAMHTWEVVTVDDDFKVDLTSMNGQYDCSLIPQIWLDAVGKDDPLITKNKIITPVGKK